MLPMIRPQHYWGTAKILSAGAGDTQSAQHRKDGAHAGTERQHCSAGIHAARVLQGIVRRTGGTHQGHHPWGMLTFLSVFHV